MTVHSLETVKDVVAELGPDRVQSVYSYEHSNSGKKLYAVFTKGSYEDIYESPYCRNPVLLFEKGTWLL